MKILVVQDRLRSGGTERQSILLARAFSAAGHATTLLTFRPGGELAPSAADLAPSALQRRDTGLDWFAPRLVATARRLAPDIVLCMGRMANCHAAALQRALPAAAVVGTMRTGKKLPWLYRRSLHRVRHIVANSHDAERLLIERHRLPREKISVIHNSLVFPPATHASLRLAATPVPSAPSTSVSASVSAETHVGSATARDEFRARFGASPQTLVMACVAMFRPEKNQRELIDLVAQLPLDLDWQLWLAGDGPTRSACAALVAGKKLDDRIKFPGFQNDPRPLYAAADLAVLSSQNESLPNFLVEAHAHGLPSVAYDVGGVAECGGLVAALGDQKHFLASLVTLLTDETARLAASAHVAAHARESFSPERQTDAYLKLFASLHSARGRPPAR